MTLFFAEFVHTDYGVTCSNVGFMDLSTAEKCSGAVNYAKTFNSLANYRYAVSWSESPKGCFITDSGYIYFNTHPTGGENRWEIKDTDKRICRKGNTYV